MKAEMLFEAFSDIEDIYIDRAAHTNYVKKKRRAVWFRIGAAAACVLLIASMSVGVYWYNDMTGIVYPEKNVKYALSNVKGQIDQLIYYTYEELGQSADIIVVADVTQAYREVNDHGFMHYAQVSVREVLKGSVKRGDSLYVHDNAIGFKDNEDQYRYGVALDGGPMLETGNRVLLFLTTSGVTFTTADGIELHEYVYGGLGKFFYDKDDKYHPSASYNEEFLDGYVSGAMLTDYESKTLDEIKRLIAQK